MKTNARRQAVCRAVRSVRRDPTILSGFTAIALALSVIFGIVASYSNGAQPAVDLDMLISTPAAQHMPADL